MSFQAAFAQLSTAGCHLNYAASQARVLPSITPAQEEAALSVALSLGALAGSAVVLHAFTHLGSMF